MTPPALAGSSSPRDICQLASPPRLARSCQLSLQKDLDAASSRGSGKHAEPTKTRTPPLKPAAAVGAKRVWRSVKQENTGLWPKTPFELQNLLRSEVFLISHLKLHF